MNIESFNKGFAFLTAAFPKTDFNAKVYFELWKDLDDEIFLKSILSFTKNQKDIYPGTNVVAHILDIARTDLYPSMGEAWEEAREAASLFPSPSFYIHPIVKEAARMIGEYEIRTGERPDITRAHFFKVYEDIVRSKNEKKLTEEPRKIESQRRLGNER